MIATAIAYSLTLFFGLVGINGLYKTAKSEEPKHNSNSWVIGSILFLFAAWGCAWLGGI